MAGNLTLRWCRRHAGDRQAERRREGLCRPTVPPGQSIMHLTEQRNKNSVGLDRPAQESYLGRHEGEEAQASRQAAGPGSDRGRGRQGRARDTAASRHAPAATWEITKRTSKAEAPGSVTKDFCRLGFE
jgi:hypothetical protein